MRWRSARWLVLTISLLPLCTVRADENPLMQEERLRKPVTVRQKMVLLPDLLRDIGKQTGVNLTCTRDLSADKLTVFVEGKPASEVLTHIATLMMGEWRKTTEGYSLSQKAQAQKWQEELLAWDRENRLQDARKTVETYMMHSERDYAELVRQVRRQREARWAGGPPNVLVTPGGEQIRIFTPVSASEDDYAELHNYLLGRILKGFTRAQWQAFWRGEVFVAATFDLPGALRLPPETLEWLQQSVQLGLPYEQEELAEAIRRQKLSEAESTQHVLLLFALDEQAGSVRTKIARYIPELPEPLTFGSIGSAAMFTTKQPLHQLEEHPCLQHWAQWQTEPRSPSSPKWLASKIVPNPNAPKPVSKYSRFLLPHPPFTLADYLQWLSQNTSNINIIADAYRTAWNAYADLPFHVTGETVGDWLQRIANSPRKAWWHAEDEWLLVKHADFWQLRPTELPEATVRQIEKKIAQGQIDTLLDDYAALAGSITPAHRYRLQMPGGYVVGFPLLIVQDHLPFLRLWASLNRVQKNATLRDGFIPLQTLSATQQRTFVQCAMEAMLEHLDTTALPFEGLSEPHGPGLVASLISAKRYEAEGMRALTNWHSLEDLQRAIEWDKKFDPGKEYRIVERDALECHYEFVVHPMLRLRSRLILTPLLGGD
ncbi:MAG: hypothetical protein ACUVSV_00475 [Armatimonadota bacterium]